MLLMNEVAFPFAPSSSDVSDVRRRRCRLLLSPSLPLAKKEKFDNASALIGVAIGVLAICWMTFDKAEWIPKNFRSPFHANMITVIGTLTIFLAGLLLSRLRRKK